MRLGGRLIALLLPLVQRLAFGAFVLGTIIYLSHLGLDMARGDDFPTALARALEKSLHYVGQLARGDLGLSAAASVTLRPIPVAEVVPGLLVKSLGLLGATMLIAIPTGLTLGLRAARRRTPGQSTITLLASIIGISTPSFFAALLLQRLVIRGTQLAGRTLLPVGGFGWDAHLLLPALVLAARPIAQITRVTYITVDEVLRQDYVRTARSKGLWPTAVMIRHVFRNAAVPILTTIGVSLRFALSSLPVVEFFFGWSGLGFTLLKAIARQDDNLTVILVLVLGALIVLVNLLLEFTYRLIDPRLRQTALRIGGDASASRRQRLRVAINDFKLIVGEQWRRLRTAGFPRQRPDPERPHAEEPALSTDDRATIGHYRQQRRLAGVRAVLANPPLVVGGLLVLGLALIFLFGPGLAPHSPYTTQGLQYVDGEFLVPPFEPDEVYPWGTDVLGRDMMSLVLAGAQQTLALTALVVLARMLVGFALGTLAGWFRESWFDHIMLRAAEVIAAFPMLLLAMILILALGIRQGFRPFIIALCLVGWGEIMQLVRGEVMTLRNRPFIEGAQATGARLPRILLQHILPNLVPTLVSVAALEMGGVLMILGELGFIGIFIGGGTFAELDVFGTPYHYADIPEWGALLSNVRPYARTYPWTAIYPSLAFFVAIVGFMLFGEGLRRVVDRVGIGITRLVNRYTLGLALLAVLGVGWGRANFGTTAFYRQYAEVFDGSRALAHTQALSDLAMEGRALGTPGLARAASYISQQFEALGLQPAGEAHTYLQTRKRDFEVLTAVPRLDIDDGAPGLVYRQDYAEFPAPFRNLGEAHGSVRLIAAGDLSDYGFYQTRFPALERLDFSNDILLLLSPDLLAGLQDAPPKGVLVLADDPATLPRRETLSPRDPHLSLFGSNRRLGQDTPMLWISQETASRLLDGSGYRLDDLLRIARGLSHDEIMDLPLEKEVHMAVQGQVAEKVPTPHVVGHLPGLSDSRYGGVNQQVIVVMAQYDSPPPAPDGAVYPGAVDNASGVAVMLEAIRALQTSGYQPYRTFLFVAYSGEGYEGGLAYQPDVTQLLTNKYGFSAAFQVEAIVDLRGLGAAEGRNLELFSGGNLRLANLFEDAARLTGVPSRRADETVDISIIFEERDFQESGQEAPIIQIRWEGWEARAGTPADTLAAIDPDHLQAAGRAVSLGLMILGREIQP